MAKILIYNQNTNRMETFFRGENEAMPYNTYGTLKVKEFRGSSKSNILWTDLRTMQAWNSQRYLYGGPIPVGSAFDVGQGWTNAQRSVLRRSAQNSGIWSYVEPVSLSPTWVHFDKRFGTPACSSGGYPLIRQGSRGNYVCIAQDDLNTLGYRTGGLDGVYGAQTVDAVKRYQASRGLASDGIVGCNTWRSLQENVVGAGKTSTTIN